MTIQIMNRAVGVEPVTVDQVEEPKKEVSEEKEAPKQPEKGEK